MEKVVGISFENNKRIYYFNPNNIEFNIEDYVIVDTERGLQFGKVVTEIIEKNEKLLNLPLKKVIRKASKKDIIQNKKNIEDAQNAMKECEKLVKGKRFVTTTAYLIAWCILQGATKIYLYGMRFTDDGNPRRQRELHNVREMIFFCMGRGIEVEICEEDIPYLFPEHIPEIGMDFDA